MNRYLSVVGLAMALAGAIEPLQAAAAAEGPLNGRWAWYQGKSNAETDHGPKNDAGCRVFLASDRYDPDSGDQLVIGNGRWSDNQDVSAVTGDVELGETKDNVIPFTMRVENEHSTSPGTGTVTRLGKITITITIESDQGRFVQHYCKVS